MESAKRDATSGEKVNILLVDDNPANLLVLEGLLEEPDRNLVRAASGREAINLHQQFDFALILLDVQMPELDGFETAELIRMNDQEDPAPIIFITALSKHPDFVSKGYDSGAVDFLFKPIQPEILCNKVGVFIALHRQKLRLRQTEAEMTRTLKDLQQSEVELRRAKKHADQLNNKLLHSNAALSDFAYMTSHDLKSPLITIRGYSNLLIQDYSDKLDKRGNDYLNRLNNVANRMGEMVENMLSYARMGYAATPAHTVDLKSVVANVKEDLLSLIDDRQVEFDAENLPAIPGSESHLTQLMQNLIENEINRNHSKTPRIAVKAWAEKDTWHVTLESNISIDNAAATDTDTDIGGHDSIDPGWALCQKIITHQNGHLWRELQPTGVPQIHFTLPDKRIGDPATNLGATEDSAANDQAA